MRKWGQRIQSPNRIFSKLLAIWSALRKSNTRLWFQGSQLWLRSLHLAQNNGMSLKGAIRVQLQSNAVWQKVTRDFKRLR